MDVDPIAVRGARASIAAVFFAHGVLIGSWAPHIRWCRDRLRLGHGTLGLVLLVMAAGALLAMPTDGGLTARFGSASS